MSTQLCIHHGAYLGIGRCPHCEQEQAEFDALGDVAETSALSTQVAGDHYRKLKIQPVEYIHRNGIGFVEGAVIKYVSRWKEKNGVEDLRKARHMLDLLIELEGK